MKYFLSIIMLGCSTLLFSQIAKPQSIEFGYFGETITHAGFKLGARYSISSKEKTKQSHNGTEKKNLKSLDFNPSVNFFHHKACQSAILLLPELNYRRTKQNGLFCGVGFGAGYMKTFLPKVYALNAKGEIEKSPMGYNYFVTNYSYTFGKDLSVKNDIPIAIYVKPQVLYAMPNFGGGVTYFNLELGIAFKLKAN